MHPPASQFPYHYGQRRPATRRDLPACCAFVERDLLGWIVDYSQIIGALGTALAIVFAARSIAVAKQQAADSNERFIRERRLQFEIETLRDLALQNVHDANVAMASERFRVLVTSLGPAVIPLAYAAIGLPSTLEGEQRLAPLLRGRQGTPRDLVKDEINEEVLTALHERVDRR